MLCWLTDDYAIGEEAQLYAGANPHHLKALHYEACPEL